MVRTDGTSLHMRRVVKAVEATMSQSYFNMKHVGRRHILVVAANGRTLFDVKLGHAVELVVYAREPIRLHRRTRLLPATS